MVGWGGRRAGCTFEGGGGWWGGWWRGTLIGGVRRGLGGGIGLSGVLD